MQRVVVVDCSGLAGLCLAGPPSRNHQPYTIRCGQTLLEVAEQVHEDFAQNLKYAKVWSEPTHSGTVVKADYLPSDRDVIEFHV